MTYENKQAGITLIEVVVAMSIITSILVVVGLSVQSYVAARAELLLSTQQLYLVEEGYEVVRAIRDSSWSDIASLSLDTTYYLDIATTSIAIGSTPEIIDGSFAREISFASVYRDGADDVVASTTPGATVDANMRLLTVRVGSVTGTSSMQVLLANLFEPS